LAGKTVGLYFSAHWCPPCRGFTPSLSENYTKHLKSKGLEIVFVSGDSDQANFDGYFGSMPWLAVPFDQQKYQAVSQRFSVNGIPALLILDEQGKVITKEGRQEVSNDPEGEKFPWSAEMKFPRGQTMQIAEQKSKPFKALREFILSVTLSTIFTAIAEAWAGIHFALQPCGLRPILVMWMLVDALLGFVSWGITVRNVLRSTWRADPELQAYLIHKERDGLVDESLEKKMQGGGLPVGSVAMGQLQSLSFLFGVIVWLSTADEGCDENPVLMMKWLVLLRIMIGLIFGCCVGPLVLVKFLAA